MRADQDDAASALLDGLDLDTLLRALVRGRGYDAALRDPPGRRGWSDTIPTSLSFMQFEERIDQLARLLADQHGRRPARPSPSWRRSAPKRSPRSWLLCAPACRR
jgi:hypothetical protein